MATLNNNSKSAFIYSLFFVYIIITKLENETYKKNTNKKEKTYKIK